MTGIDSNKHPKEEHAETQFAHLLPPNHRRSLSTLLRRLELATRSLEARITCDSAQPLLLTRFSNPPTEEQSQVLGEIARQLRQEIAQLAADWHLEQETQDLSRTIQAECTLLWCDLEDSWPHRLENYGPLPAQAKALLEPRIARLIELVLRVESVMKRR